MIIWITDRIAIGDLHASRAGLSGFAGVISITENDVSVRCPHFHWKIADGRPWPPEAQEQLLNFLRQRLRVGKVLIHCDQGISRSVSAVLLWLTAVGFSLEEALELIRSKHPGANPNTVIVKSLVTLQGR